MIKAIFLYTVCNIFEQPNHRHLIYIYLSCFICKSDVLFALYYIDCADFLYANKKHAHYISRDI